MSSNLIRWGGLAAMLGGALFVVLLSIQPFVGESHALFHTLSVPPFALLALGIAGLYLRQKERFGWLGKVGFYLPFTGFALMAVGGLTIIFVEVVFGAGSTPGWLDAIVHMVAFLLVIVGSVLFAVAILRASVLPKGGAWLLIIGLVLFLGVDAGGGESPWLVVLPSALFGAGWAWLGYVLWSGKEEPVRQAARAS